MEAQYAILSGFYDRLMSDIDYNAWAHFYTECFCKYGKAEKVLDLACGTGNITLPLAALGYDMIGIDGSAEMLSLARKKADDMGLSLCLSEQNIASFDAGYGFDAAICSFDGINYLTASGDVFSCFSRTYDALVDGGLFIFDVSTPYKYENILASETYVYEYDDLFVTWQNHYNGKTKLCDFDLTFFVKAKNGWRRYDESQRQRAYSFRFLEKKLKEAGFSILEQCSDIDFSVGTEMSDRRFYICRKNGKNLSQKEEI